MDLSKKHQAFINEYFLCNMNGTQAYLRVYPKASEPTARANSSDLLAKTNIAAEIQRRLAEKQLSADEVLIHLGEQARSGHSAYLRPDGTVDLTKLLADGKGHLIHKVKPNKYGVEVEFYDAQNALQLIGKQHGLFADSHIVTHKVEQELDKALDLLEQNLDADTYNQVLAILSNGGAGGSP